MAHIVSAIGTVDLFAILYCRHSVGAYQLDVSMSTNIDRREKFRVKDAAIRSGQYTSLFTKDGSINRKEKYTYKQKYTINKNESRNIQIE